MKTEGWCFLEFHSVFWILLSNEKRRGGTDQHMTASYLFHSSFHTVVSDLVASASPGNFLEMHIL